MRSLSTNKTSYLSLQESIHNLNKTSWFKGKIELAMKLRQKVEGNLRLHLKATIPTTYGLSASSLKCYEPNNYRQDLVD